MARLILETVWVTLIGGPMDGVVVGLEIPKFFRGSFPIDCHTDGKKDGEYLIDTETGRGVFRADL